MPAPTQHYADASQDRAHLILTTTPRGCQLLLFLITSVKRWRNGDTERLPHPSYTPVGQGRRCRQLDSHLCVIRPKIQFPHHHTHTHTHTLGVLWSAKILCFPSFKPGHIFIGTMAHIIPPKGLMHFLPHFRRQCRLGLWSTMTYRSSSTSLLTNQYFSHYTCHLCWTPLEPALPISKFLCSCMSSTATPQWPMKRVT